MRYISVFGFGAHYIVDLTVIYCEIIGRDFAQVILYIVTIDINASLMAMSFPLWSCLSNKSNTDVYHYHYYESHIKHMRKFAWYIILVQNISLAKELSHAIILSCRCVISIHWYRTNEYTGNLILNPIVFSTTFSGLWSPYYFRQYNLIQHKSQSRNIFFRLLTAHEWTFSFTCCLRMIINIPGNIQLTKINSYVLTPDS